jgi:hypothetical protein
MGRATDADAWPPLPLEAWSDTAATLHRWLQIVGKIRLGHCPWIKPLVAFDGSSHTLTA